MIALFRELVERRVPQWLAIYLGVSWGVVQFIAFLEERYQLSPDWTNLALVTFALLIPSVLLFIYNHGKPGPDELQRSEKIGIPVNLGLAVLVLFFLFENKDLGAIVTQVQTTDESGQTVERTVAKSSFRKRVALFNFDGAAGDTAATWLLYGLPHAINIDLLQDMFVDVRPSAAFKEKLRQLGYRSELNVPLALKRSMAEEAHQPYFTEAKLTRGAEGVQVDFALYETNTGKLVQRRTFIGTDPFVLADEISAALKKDLDVPDNAQVRDLPVSDVMTSSLPAFRTFIEGINAVHLEDNWQQGVAMLEQAMQLDPTFAIGQLALHNVYLFTNQSGRSMPPLVGSSRVDLQACKLEYSIVSPK